jgi:hypothetical protein
VSCGVISEPRLVDVALYEGFDFILVILHIALAAIEIASVVKCAVA